MGAGAGAGAGVGAAAAAVQPCGSVSAAPTRLKAPAVCPRRPRCAPTAGVSGADIWPWVEEALDSIEFITGPSNRSACLARDCAVLAAEPPALRPAPPAAVAWGASLIPRPPLRPAAARGARCVSRWGTQSPGPSTGWPSAMRWVQQPCVCACVRACVAGGAGCGSRHPAGVQRSPAESVSRAAGDPAAAPIVPQTQDCGKPFYVQNYVAFFAAIRARYPHMRLVSNCDMGQVQGAVSAGAGGWARGCAAAAAVLCMLPPRCAC